MRTIEERAGVGEHAIRKIRARLSSRLVTLGREAVANGIQQLADFRCRDLPNGTIVPIRSFFQKDTLHLAGGAVPALPDLVPLDVVLDGFLVRLRCEVTRPAFHSIRGPSR